VIAKQVPSLVPVTEQPEPAADPLDGLPVDQFDALIRKGRARGGLTQDDVMTVLRSVELNADLIAGVVQRIRDAGVEFTYDTGERPVSRSSTCHPWPTSRRLRPGWRWRRSGRNGLPVARPPPSPTTTPTPSAGRPPTRSTCT
jgi:hypothetical protein